MSGGRKMVEAVARAIAAAHYGDGADEPWECFVVHARAAIEAMRKPREAMLRAAHDGPLLADDHEMDGKVREWLADMWQAMLTAALEERRDG